MSMTTLSIELPEESLATMDEIAHNRSTDQVGVLRHALNVYLDDYAAHKADLDEADRQIEAGDTVTHDEVVAWFEAQHAQKAEAA